MDYDIINYIDDLQYVRYSLRNVYHKQILTYYLDYTYLSCISKKIDSYQDMKKYLKYVSEKIDAVYPAIYKCKLKSNVIFKNGGKKW